MYRAAASEKRILPSVRMRTALRGGTTIGRSVRGSMPCAPRKVAGGSDGLPSRARKRPSAAAMSARTAA